MNVEALDELFAALIAGLENVMPSEYNREVFGGEMSDACEFGSLEEANEIFGLMMRYWNTIEAEFQPCFTPITLRSAGAISFGSFVNAIWKALLESTRTADIRLEQNG